jgi:hypothetical protein
VGYSFQLITSVHPYLLSDATILHILNDMPTTSEHADVRWNPDLMEWFCARCGMTSDHVNEQDAKNELSNHQCEMVGTAVKPLTRQQRKFRNKSVNR